MSPASLPVGSTAGLRLRGQCGSGQHRIDILVGPPSGGPGPVAPGNPPRENRRGRGLATRGSLAAQRGRRSPPGRPSRAPKGVPLRAAHAAARRMLLLCGCRASDAHYGESAAPLAADRTPRGARSPSPFPERAGRLQGCGQFPGDAVRPYRLLRAPKDIGRRSPSPEASSHITSAARKAPSLSSG